MMLKVDPITVVIIVLIALIPCAWIGGGFVEKKEQQKMPAKTIVHDTKVIVDSKTTSKAEANAYSVNIFKDGTMFKTLTISTAGTNIEVSVTSNKKETWKTNDTQ